VVGDTQFASHLREMFIHGVVEPVANWAMETLLTGLFEPQSALRVLCAKRVTDLLGYIFLLYGRLAEEVVMGIEFE
jgi:hypothetical protein